MKDEDKIKEQSINELAALGRRVTELEVSEREYKRANQALRESEEKYRNLFHHSNDAIFIHDLDGNIIDVNQKVLDLFGYPKAEIMSLQVSELHSPGQFEKYHEALDAISKNGFINFEIDFKKKNGEIFSAEVSSSMFEIGGKKVIQGIVRNITKRKRAEEELKKYRDHLEEFVNQRTEQLEAANKELESFAYSVSHDLRAPLRAMEGFANALLEDYAGRLDAMGKDYAQRIVAAAQHMDALIQDLLAYSRLSRSAMRLMPVSLENVLSEVVHQFSTEVEKSGAQIRVERPLPEVMGDHATLVQVLSNLISNAMKFVEPGVKPYISVWAEEKNEKVRLWIEDKGIGIAPEYYDRIFRIFERLQGAEAYPGTGVGLAIVKKGIERMGGRTGVESFPGKGSKFWIELRMRGN